MNARSMSGGTSPWWRGSSATRLLWSYHSYSRVPGSAGASGFDHESRRWKIGKERNIPPGASSREIVACSIPNRERQ